MTKAAILEAPGQPLRIDDVTIDNPGPHEVLIRTAACGLCHSDLHFIEGTYPHPLPAIPGHEAAGIVEKVGSEVRTVKPGDAVVTCLSAFCGHCEFCVTGRMALCMGGDTRRAPGAAPRITRASDGSMVNQMLNLSAFAEMMLVHEHACVRINPEMPLDRAAVIRGAAPGARRVSPPMHSAIRPVTQNSQCPQNAERQVTTASPGFTVRTSLPTFSTIPAASWPGIAGRG